MKKEKASVLLDLDDTLLDFHKAEAIALSRALREIDIEPKKETLELYSEINKQQWHRLELGLASREEILLKRFQILFEGLGLRRSAEQARDLYEDYLCEGHFFIDGAPELLETLCPRYNLYLVSNGTGKVQAGRMRSADIVKYFKEIFVSEEIGFNKPEREYFMRCFERIEGFEPERAVIVGDSLSSDVLGGINAGIKTIWFNPKHLTAREDIVPDYELDSLCILPDMLQEILT